MVLWEGSEKKTLLRVGCTVCCRDVQMFLDERNGFLCWCGVIVNYDLYAVKLAAAAGWLVGRCRCSSVSGYGKVLSSEGVENGSH